MCVWRMHARAHESSAGPRGYMCIIVSDKQLKLLRCTILSLPMSWQCSDEVIHLGNCDSAAIISGSADALATV